MTREVYSLRPSQGLSEAIAEFDRRMISGAPVINEHWVAVGHLSRSTISSFLASSGKHPRELLVGEVMEDFVLRVSAQDTVKTLVEKMLTGRIHRLIVSDPAGRPVGIVTTMDVMGYFYDQMNR
jgi:predicted transcriptional regulator